MPTEFRILYVDDDPVLLELVGQTLTDAGYALRTEMNPLLAAATDWHSVDLLITDFSMPAMDGLTLAKRAQAGAFTGEVILFSGSIIPETKSRAEEMGIRHIIDKGQGPGTLLVAVRALHAAGKQSRRAEFKLRAGPNSRPGIKAAKPN